MQSPEKLITTMPPGSALYASASIGGGMPETTFLFREENRRIAKLGSPTIAIRSGLFTEGGVGLVPCLVCVDAEVQENIWEVSCCKRG